MTVKFIAVSGDMNQGEAVPLGGKVLGLHYDMASDIITFDLTPGFNRKNKGGDKEKIFINEEMLTKMKTGEMHVSRRFLLSIVMAYYDPLGLIGPLLLKAKVMLQKLYGPEAEVGWDTDISICDKVEWVNWLKEMLDTELVIFRRGTRPPGAIGDPWVIGFSDGSLTAYCATVYI